VSREAVVVAVAGRDGGRARLSVVKWRGFDVCVWVFVSGERQDLT
jgi:hypothetical protein